MYEFCLLHIKKHKRLVTSAWDAVTKRKEPWDFFFVFYLGTMGFRVLFCLVLLRQNVRAAPISTKRLLQKRRRKEKDKRFDS